MQVSYSLVILSISDKRKQGKSCGGRISAVTDTNTFTLDREFAVDSGYQVSDYKVSISFQDKNVYSHKTQ